MTSLDSPRELQRHDIARPEALGDGFKGRHWSAVNGPVINAGGALACHICLILPGARPVPAAFGK
jgi:hypothetical protein